ncbi:MAG TPA: Hint domain-containing protein, partial [Longimicrobium sp.]|nr:Hint domain-containing protein [Longimicrobium sp.]
TQQCQTNGATQCVNSGATTNMIKVCYGPRIQSDCDYGCQGSGVPPNVIFPIQGSVDLGQQPLTPLTGTVYIVLQDAAGGGCVLEATSNTSPVDSLITMNGTVASWNLAPASFPNKSCLQTNGMVMNYTFQLFLQTQGSFVGVTFTSDTSQASSPNTVMVPQLDIIEGCLPDGVKIRMEDGSEKLVESFQGYGNEKVRSRNPASRAVTATTWGSEAKPLVSLRTSGGHSLLLTETHPVITPRGPVMAFQLKRGDVVLTEGGQATLTEVSRRANPRPVPVHNLRVGSREEAARGQTTFFANGILVGDQQMQRHVYLQSRTPRQRSREEIMAALPREWHRDFQNAKP